MVEGTNHFLLSCFLYSLYTMYRFSGLGVGDEGCALFADVPFSIEVHEKSNLLPVWSDGFMITLSAFNLPFWASYIQEPTRDNDDNDDNDIT